MQNSVVKASGEGCTKWGGREESAQPGSVGESQLRLEVGISFGPKGKEREKDIPGRGNEV